ncbi:MAG: proline dehydrogenase family protein [Acidobacteriota bacterium]
MLRTLFIHLSANRRFRAFAERSPLGRRVARRFVAGLTIEEALAAAVEMNRRGMAVTIDSLGENVATPAEAESAAAIYHRLLDEISRRDINANVSLKLTQMGLDVDPALARQLLLKLVTHAASVNRFVRVDMEGSSYTQTTLDLVHDLHRGHPNRVGAVIQSCLRRSEEDVERLLADGIRIRLCKGAYQEPPEVAFPSKAGVDANYLRLMKKLLESGLYHGIATHDERMIGETIQLAKAGNIAPDSFEFQMLYGIRRDLQQSLVRQGWRMRVYIPFGTAWYPYFMRRLAERPANLWFVLSNLLRG